MLINFKEALGLDNKITRYARGGEKEKRYFSCARVIAAAR